MSLENESMNRNLILGEEVEDSSVKNLIQKIVDINYDDDIKQERFTDFERKPIKLYINTNGGSVLCGFGLIGVIQNSKTPIYTICTGKALSMGLPILVSGHKRFAYKYSTMMYHEISGFMYDKMEGIKQELGEAKREQIMLDNIILDNTNILQEKLDQVKELKKEWYISADEALKLGIIDKIIK